MQIRPQGLDDVAEGSTLRRMSLEKQFQGDLVAKSKGEMLTASTTVESSAGYVAIERVVGSLHGHPGSFVLQHCGILTSASQQLTLMVVPDSGSGELVGLSGKMGIRIEDGQHSYDFEYALPAASTRP